MCKLKVCCFILLAMPWLVLAKEDEDHSEVAAFNKLHVLYEAYCRLEEQSTRITTKEARFKLDEFRTLSEKLYTSEGTTEVGITSLVFAQIMRRCLDLPIENETIDSAIATAKNDSKLKWAVAILVLIRAQGIDSRSATINNAYSEVQMKLNKIQAIEYLEKNLDVLQCANDAPILLKPMIVHLLNGKDNLAALGLWYIASMRNSLNQYDKAQERFLEIAKGFPDTEWAKAATGASEAIHSRGMLKSK